MSMEQDFVRLWDWLGTNGVALGIVISLAVAGTSLLRYWWVRPRLAFALDVDSCPEEATIAITNVGDRAAEDVRATWVRRSPMDMGRIPQPQLILAKQTLNIELTMAHDDRLLHNMADGYDLKSSPFGYLIVSWKRPIRRGRSRAAVLPLDAYGGGRLSTSITLGKVPRTPINESRIARWGDRASGRERRRLAVLEYSRKSGERLQLAHAIKSLGDAGVILPKASDEEKAHLVLGELGRRGWEWEFQTVGPGYRVDASKLYLPSSRASVTSSRQTLFEAAVIALDMAIGSDAEHGETFR